MTVLLMILAGILYSCSRRGADGLFSDGSENGVLLLEQEDRGNGTSEAGVLPEGGQSSPSETGDLPESGQTGTTSTGPEDAQAAATGPADGPDRPSAELSGAGAGTDPDTCFVHICGAVEKPGVYGLPKGSRIYQAVEMAGGFLAGADERYVNLAALVSDGMHVTIYTEEEAETAPRTVSAQDGAGAGTDRPARAGSGPEPSKIDINTAGKEELMTLKGIGETRAQAIITYREGHGPFQRIEDIMLVPGIKEGAFQKIKEEITI